MSLLVLFDFWKKVSSNSAVMCVRCHAIFWFMVFFQYCFSINKYIFILVWPTSWTPAVGDLFVSVCLHACVRACLRACM